MCCATRMGVIHLLIKSRFDIDEPAFEVIRRFCEWRGIYG